MLGKHTKRAFIGGGVILALCFGGALYLNERPAHHSSPARTERISHKSYRQTRRAVKKSEKAPKFKGTKLKSSGSNHYRSTGTAN